MPDANDLTIHIIAAVAVHEANRISQRTKDALAVAKSRGVQLGKASPANLRPNVEKRHVEAAAFVDKLRPQTILDCCPRSNYIRAPETPGILPTSIRKLHDQR
jgi:DNA invertase Pin-like site-specific DNA recombinase